MKNDAFDSAQFVHDRGLAAHAVLAAVAAHNYGDDLALDQAELLAEHLVDRYGADAGAYIAELAVSMLRFVAGDDQDRIDDLLERERVNLETWLPAVREAEGRRREQ